MINYTERRQGGHVMAVITEVSAVLNPLEAGVAYL